MKPIRYSNDCMQVSIEYPDRNLVLYVSNKGDRAAFFIEERENTLKPKNPQTVEAVHAAF